MDKVKKFIDLYIPITKCNLRCSYCYITQQNLFDSKAHPLKYPVETIIYALRPERLGGICCFNICGGGETMLSHELIDIVKGLAEYGHYIMIVTNGTISKKFDEFVSLPEHIRKKILFKFSFQYLELKRLNLLNEFLNNVNKVKNAGCSFSLELAASDDLIPMLEEIKETCIKNVGALCHVTVLRDDRLPGRPILTKLSPQKYKETWEQFNSEMFNLRLSLWGQKRREFCYAGLWSACLSLESGGIRKCNSCKEFQNIFENPDTPINFNPVGYNCPEKHCYISHAWLTFGDIPELKTPTFMHMRIRVCTDGSEWLTKEY